MNTQHTKGKWYVSGDLKNQVKTNLLPSGILVANVNPINAYSEEEAFANAKLIAAAPELLNALSFLLNDLDRNDGDLINRATLINEAKQAINKATK